MGKLQYKGQIQLGFLNTAALEPSDCWFVEQQREEVELKHASRNEAIFHPTPVASAASSSFSSSSPSFLSLLSAFGPSFCLPPDLFILLLSNSPHSPTSSFSMVLTGRDPRASCLLGKYSITKLHILLKSFPIEQFEIHLTTFLSTNPYSLYQ